MNNHFQWLDVIECNFSGRIVDSKEELHKKYPYVFILGKLGRGNTVNSRMNPSKRGER
ncbi:MAG: hypothetical protein H9W80_05005 [Enterococcus sp.]|nr:hypothetical protein [Enterococcus sp.]